ncbi:MAG: hypothetical protein ACXAC7_17155 [Candidatus Hodarchaeales archaeon]|jgi:hypothetical protein
MLFHFNYDVGKEETYIIEFDLNNAWRNYIKVNDKFVLKRYTPSFYILLIYLIIFFGSISVTLDANNLESSFLKGFFIFIIISFILDFIILPVYFLLLEKNPSYTFTIGENEKYIVEIKPIKVSWYGKKNYIVYIDGEEFQKFP